MGLHPVVQYCDVKNEIMHLKPVLKLEISINVFIVLFYYLQIVINCHLIINALLCSTK